MALERRTALGSFGLGLLGTAAFAQSGPNGGVTGPGSNTASVKTFGARGDGITDDTAAIQTAINAVRAAGGGVVYYPGPATYLVTKSLNSTGTGQNTPIIHKGDGKSISVILHAFPVAEAFPVIDGCGNTRGGVTGLSIIPQGTSFATCAYLAAKGAAGGAVGNTQIFSNSIFQAGNVAGDCGFVAYNSDLTRIEDCEVYGAGGGISVGFSKPANITSKFITIPGTTDWTQGYIINCEVNSTASPALIFNTGGSLTVINSFFSLINAGTAGKVVNIVSNGVAGCQLLAFGLRTENPSSATGVSSLYFSGGGSLFGEVIAALETDSSGFMIGSDNSSLITGYRFKVTGSTGKLLNIGTAGIIQSEFIGECGSGGVGTVGNAANCYDLTFIGNFNTAQVETAVGSIMGLRISQSAIVYDSTNNVYFYPTLTSQTAQVRTNALQSGNVVNRGITGNSVAGDGSPHTFATITLPLAVLSNWDNGTIAAQVMDVQLDFNVNAFAAAGTFAIALTQGVNTATLFSFTPPTGNQPTTVRIRLSATSNPAVLAQSMTTVIMGTTVTAQQAGLNGTGIVPASGNATLTFTFTTTNAIAATTLWTTIEV